MSILHWQGARQVQSSSWICLLLLKPLIMKLCLIAFLHGLVLVALSSAGLSLTLLIVSNVSRLAQSFPVQGHCCLVSHRALFLVLSCFHSILLLLHLSLPNTPTLSSTSCHADDTQLYIHLTHLNANQALDKLNKCLEDVKVMDVCKLTQFES